MTEPKVPMTLKRLREAAGLSQDALGRLIAAPDSKNAYFQPRIFAYESGRKRVPLPVALKLVKILNANLRKNKSRLIAKTEHLVHETQR